MKSAGRKLNSAAWLLVEAERHTALERRHGSDEECLLSLGELSDRSLDDLSLRHDGFVDEFLCLECGCDKSASVSEMAKPDIECLSLDRSAWRVVLYQGSVVKV